MKRLYMLFGMTLLFSLFLLAVNAWGAPYISFNSIRIGETGLYIGIYIMDTDGRNARRVSPPRTWSGNPAWSLDGKWIAYDAFEAGIGNPLQNQNPNADRHIFIVSVEGGEPRQITQHPGLNYSPAWVPESFFSVSPTVDTQTTLWGWLKQAERMTQ